MIGEMTTVWAVMRKEDTRARALFTSAEDAGNMVADLNEGAQTEAARYKVYPWNIPSEMFDTEE